MKAIRLNKSIPDYLNSVKQCYYSTQVNPAYPYTSELYKKNYIKYPVQSRSAICHDYVYHGNERLPSLEERLKGGVNFGKKNHSLDFSNYFFY